VLLDLLAMLSLGEGCWDRAPGLAARIVSAQDLLQVELLQVSPDGAVRRCSTGHLRGDLVTWVIDCVWGRSGVAAELAHGRSVAWIREDLDPAHATVCVPVFPGDDDRVVVACSLAAFSGEPLVQAASRLTLLTSLLSRDVPARQWAPKPRRGTTDKSSSLSSRQLTILAAMAEGMTNRQIAAQISFSESTVRLESMAIYRYFGVHSRAAAVAAARRTGELLSPDVAVSA
jgi:DNA-binding CsgD family transcriptional regulator